MLPFTTEQFFEVFRRYNTDVWPAQLALTGAGLLAIHLALRPRPRSDQAVAAILGLLWAWMGGVYHLYYFRAINPAALGFGVAFLAESALLFWFGVVRARLRFRARRTGRGLAGGLLLAFALVVYPLLGRSFGQGYPASATFGLPCPTTIATLGFVLWMNDGAPLAVSVVPLLWAAIGASAALLLGVREDFGLGLAGLTTLGYLLDERRTSQPMSAS